MRNIGSEVIPSVWTDIAALLNHKTAQDLYNVSNFRIYYIFTDHVRSVPGKVMFSQVSVILFR